MGVALLPFIAEEELQRAVIVLDIALARGCRYKSALGYAVESIEAHGAEHQGLAKRLIEKRWRQQVCEAR